MEPLSFQRRFCERFGCLSNQYENRAFRELLYGHAKLIAPIVRGVRPDFFAEDLEFIRDLGQATDLREANASALCFQDANRARPSLWRRRLRIRVSGGKAVRLAGKLFSEALERVSQMVDPTQRSSSPQLKDPQQTEIAGT